MIDPQPGDAGRTVIYTPGHVDWHFWNTDNELFGGQERGVISSWNEHAVFVRYGRGSTAAATRREDLSWEEPKKPAWAENPR